MGTYQGFVAHAPEERTAPEPVPDFPEPTVSFGRQRLPMAAKDDRKAIGWILVER